MIVRECSSAYMVCGAAVRFDGCVGMFPCLMYSAVRSLPSPLVPRTVSRCLCSPKRKSLIPPRANSARPHADRAGRSSLARVPVARHTAPLAPCRDERCRPARAVRLRPGRLPLGQGDVPDERRAGAERCGAQRHVDITLSTAGQQHHSPAVCWPSPEPGDAEVDLGPRWRLGQARDPALALREASEAPAGRSLRHVVIAHTGTRRAERARRGRARRAERERHHRAARGRPHRAAGACRRPAPWDARGARELGRHALRRAGGLPAACAPPARCPIAARSPHHAPRVHEHGTSTWRAARCRWAARRCSCSRWCPGSPCGSCSCATGRAGTSTRSAASRRSPPTRRPRTSRASRKPRVRRQAEDRPPTGTGQPRATSTSL